MVFSECWTSRLHRQQQCDYAEESENKLRDGRQWRLSSRHRRIARHKGLGKTCQGPNDDLHPLAIKSGEGRHFTVA